LQVNTDNHIVDMRMKSVSDPSLLVDVDAIKQTIEDVKGAVDDLTTNMTIKDTIRIDASLEGAYINENGELVTVTQDASGEWVETVQPLPVKPDGTLVQGSDGEEYVLTSDGKLMGKEEFENTGGNSRLMDKYNKEREEKAQPYVTFLVSPNQTYGFDEYDNKIKKNIESEYPELKAGYRPAFKSVEAYKTDKVQINSDENIVYRTEFGVPITRSGNELIIRGGEGGSETILYAYNKQDSTTIVGKLNILSLKEQTEQVCLVSVNGATLPNKTALEDVLEKIYKPAVTKWEVSIGKALTNITFTNEQMTHGGSGFATMYNADQKTLINALKKTQTPDKETLYLFFVDGVTGKEGVTGYMPIQYQYGFIYDYRNGNESNIAHELAHGAFNLPHSFDKPILAEQKTTNNLMDYNQKTELWKHQWKLIHNPKNQLFKFLQDEEKGEISLGMGELPGFAPDGRIVFEKKGYKTILLSDDSRYIQGFITDDNKTYRWDSAKKDYYNGTVPFNTWSVTASVSGKVAVWRKGNMDCYKIYKYIAVENYTISNFAAIQGSIDSTDGDWIADFDIDGASDAEKEKCKEAAQGQIDKLTEYSSKRIMLFVNGYRFGLPEPANTDNSVYNGDKFGYWEGFDKQFIKTRKNDLVYYLDGHMKIETSNHFTMDNFYCSARLTIQGWPSNYKEAVLRYGDAGAGLLFGNILIPVSVEIGCRLLYNNSETTLNTFSNTDGFNRRKTEGYSAGMNLYAQLVKDQVASMDTLDIVCHSMGFAYAQGVIEALKESGLNIGLGGYYIIAPENACAGTVNVNEWQQIWQYGSDELNHPIHKQDGVAPQCQIQSLYDVPNKSGRAYIPEDVSQGFVSSHSVENYKWIFTRKMYENGYVMPRK